MKILQIIQRPQLRGAEIFACQLSVHLQNLGHQVEMLVLFGRSQDQALDFPLPFYFLEATEAKRFSDFKAYKQLAKLVKEGNYDIIQANAGDTLKYAAISKYLYHWKTPLVFRNANKISDFIRGTWHKRLNALWVRKCAAVISVSELCRQDFIETFQFPQEKIFTGTIGVNLVQKAEIPQDIQVLRTKGPLLLHVGGFVPEKNHQALLRIFKQIQQQVSNVQLVLLGKGKLETETKQQVQQLGLQDNVHFLGWRQDVLDVMQASTLFVLPSLIEGLPGVILEAQMLGLPVIAYNVGGISEVIADDQTGGLIKAGDEQGFVAKCLSYIASDITTSIAHNARNQVYEHFDNHKLATQFLQFYQQILS